MTELVDRPASTSVTRSPDELEPIETASRDEISALQLSRLKWSLRHAYDNVPHYRNAFDQAGVHPDDLKDLADLALFPFTTKADLRQNYPFGMFAVPQSEVVRVHASSGTTGRPTVVGYTAADIDTRANLVARCLHAAGVRSTDKVHIAYGYGLFTGGLGAHYGAERLVHRDSGVRRDDRTPTPTDHRLCARHHGHAELHADPGGRDGARRHRPAQNVAAHRCLRRRTLDRTDACRARK
jgi:phenylacetate-CoA ligase